eukprot:symbB.v1.2.014270.t1/scaffold1033.1/size247163/8
MLREVSAPNGSRVETSGNPSPYLRKRPAMSMNRLAILASWSLALVASRWESDEVFEALESSMLLQLNIDRASSEPVDQDIDYSRPKGCWDTHPAGKEIFYLHLNKIGGCSMTADLAKVVGRSNMFSNEVCLHEKIVDDFPFNVTVTMLRRPLDHVLSMYHQCTQAPNPILFKLGVGVGQPGCDMPDTFAEWMHAWVEKPREDYDAHLWENMFHCKNPTEVISHQLLCTQMMQHFATINTTAAVSAMESISFVGILEAYHESFCLFIAGTRHFLPSHCNCEDEAQWNSFNQTKEEHGHEYTDKIEDYPEEVLQDVEELTKTDKMVYQKEMERFLKDMDQLEKTFGVKVLCPAQPDTLLHKIQ